MVSRLIKDTILVRLSTPQYRVTLSIHRTITDLKTRNYEKNKMCRSKHSTEKRGLLYKNNT